MNILKENNLDIPFTLKLVDILKNKGITINNKDDILKEINNL